MNHLPQIDPALLRQMQQIDAELEREWQEHCKGRGYGVLAGIFGVLLVVAALFAMVYPIVQVLK